MTAQVRETAFSVPLWLVWAAAFSFVLIGLGSYGILDNNEGLYAEIPREMLASHDWRHWVIPYLNGLPYMEKPPLLYWLTALSFVLFGVSEWSARLVPALSSLACVALLVWFGQAVRRPQAGRLAALMFVSGLGVTAMSRVLMFDMLLTALLSAALMCFFLYLQCNSVRLLRAGYALLAFALLAKGLVALVLFGSVTAVFMLSTCRCGRELAATLKKCAEPWALLIFLAVAVPWHVAASLTEPIFAWFYFVNEHVLRFLGRREPHDYYAGAWWYYLPRMAIYLFPWSLLLLCCLKRSARIPDAQEAALQRFLLLAWLVPLLFFSVSSAKANYYLVVVMPFAAMHLAAAIENRGFLKRLARALPAWALGALALALCAALIMRGMESSTAFMVHGWELPSFLLGVTFGCALLSFVCGLLALYSERIGVLAYIALPAWIAAALLAAAPSIESRISTRQTVDYLQTAFADRPVYLYRNFEEQSSLPFYLKKPVPVIDSRSNDLFWGNKLRKNDIVLSNEQFDQRLQNQPLAVVVMERQLKDFRSTAFFARFKGEKRLDNVTIFFN